MRRGAQRGLSPTWAGEDQPFVGVVYASNNHLTSHNSDMRSRLPALAAVLAVGVLTVPASAAQPVSPQSGGKSSVMVARYDFDGRAGAVIDDSGHGHTMRLVSSRGGRLRLVR